MTANAETTRSRALRGAILRALWIHDSAGLEIGFAAAELSALNADSIFGRRDTETSQMIRDLIERGLIRAADDDNPPRFVLTADGRDFCRAEYPWGRIDPYTGGARGR